MMNLALYKREMKSSIRLLLIFAAVITLYIAMIISMYDPELVKILDHFVEAMPELMSSVGMKANAVNLLEFMVSYLYGFVLLIFPMIFCMLRGNSLVARYVEKGSMVSLIAAPIKRRTVAFTQMLVLVSGILFLGLYSTGLELICAAINFPGELEVIELFRLNGGLLCLHLFVGGICFLASCIFSDTRYSIGFGAGIPTVMYILQMLANVGGKAEKAKYFTFFTLFQPDSIIANESGAILSFVVLLIGAVVMYVLGIVVFSKKDLYI
ncbi:MAG: ABC transporter permease [Lachnospiraceae bacterium]|nr:ABC transporter permease [Lachnospiraceae bacterium]